MPTPPQPAATPQPQDIGVPPPPMVDVIDEAPETQEVGAAATTEAPTGADLGGLTAAYNEDPVVRLILDHFASRQRNQNITEIEVLLDALARAGTPSEKPALIHAFRRLDALGVGRFLAGRRGHPTRFEWREKSLTARSLAVTGA